MRIIYIMSVEKFFELPPSLPVESTTGSGNINEKTNNNKFK
jgi:hypothetical protein